MPSADEVERGQSKSSALPLAFGQSDRLLRHILVQHNYGASPRPRLAVPTRNAARPVHGVQIRRDDRLLDQRDVGAEVPQVLPLRGTELTVVHVPGNKAGHVRSIGDWSETRKASRRDPASAECVVEAGQRLMAVLFTDAGTTSPASQQIRSTCHRSQRPAPPCAGGTCPLPESRCPPARPHAASAAGTA